MTFDPALGDDAEDYEECASCKHYPAYHDKETGRPCRAWDPDQPDNLCACKGWKKPKPKPAPAAAPDEP